MIEEHKIIKQQNAKKITEIESKLKTPGIDSKDEKSLIIKKQELIDSPNKNEEDDEYYYIAIKDEEQNIKEAEKALGVKDKEVKDEISKVIEEQKTVDAKTEEKVKELEKDIVKTAEEKRQEKRERKREISKQK